MIEKRIVSTENAPAAIGPYSQAVVAGGVVYCSGQVALDPQTGEMVGDTAAAQAEHALVNLMNVLEAAGASRESVVRCTVYLVDMGEFGNVNEVYAQVFPGDEPPARACVEVAGLPKGALVEIDAIAVIG